MWRKYKTCREEGGYQGDSVNCGVHTCINAYNLLAAKPLVYSNDDMVSLRYWIADVIASYEIQNQTKRKRQHAEMTTIEQIEPKDFLANLIKIEKPHSRLFTYLKRLLTCQAKQMKTRRQEKKLKEEPIGEKSIQKEHLHQTIDHIGISKRDITIQYLQIMAKDATERHYCFVEIMPDNILPEFVDLIAKEQKLNTVPSIFKVEPKIDLSLQNYVILPTFLQSDKFSFAV